MAAGAANGSARGLPAKQVRGIEQSLSDPNLISRDFRIEASRWLFQQHFAFAPRGKPGERRERWAISNRQRYGDCRAQTKRSNQEAD